MVVAVGLRRFHDVEVEAIVQEKGCPETARAQKKGKGKGELCSLVYC